MDFMRIISQAGPLGWLTLGILLFMSVMSWAIIAQKYRYMSRMRKHSNDFLQKFWNSRNLENLYESSKESPISPALKMFTSGYVELVKLSQGKSKKDEGARLELDQIDNIERALRRSLSSEVGVLQKFLAFLATTGSTAPFIGLFGTVVGIMRSFHQIGLAGQASIADVAPGISEALFATACGLAAAIPAVVAYNFFINQVRRMTTDLENFGIDFLNIVKRNFFA